MRLRITLVVLLLLSPMFATAKLKVVASIFPCFDFARTIGGENVEVSMLLPPGVEAHSFDPTPGQIMSLNKSDIFIFTNKYMEPWVEGMIKGMPSVKFVTVDLGEGINFLMEGDAGVLKEHHGADPHTWLDPANSKLMAENIAKAFSKKDPDNAAKYRKNYALFEEKLKVLDRSYIDALKLCRLKRFYFAGHFAFGYFCRHFGLEYTSPYKGFSPDAEPTPKAMIEIIKSLKQNKIKYIFHEELISPKIAEVISNESGCEMLRLSAAHNVTRKEIDAGFTYFDIMNANLISLKKGLEWH